MAMNTGQTLNDRLNAARYALAGQGLARVVCKATTEEVIGPKKKHLDYLLQCTHEPNVSIPQMANLLIERTNHSSWVVVFKALVTVHHLMCYGNERFTQYLASSNCNFQLSNFLDKAGVKGYDMSTFIRRYSKYINEKALSYRTVAFDFCKIKRGKEDGSLRTMPTDKLLKTIPTLQSQIDALLEFDCTANDLTNGVINAAFMLLFRDLIRLFACYNDGIINLLEKFFDMNRKQCREALEIYKKFLIRMDRVAEFLKVAENVGIDKGEIPDLTKAPSSLLDALEQHLQSLEGNKKGSKTKDGQPAQGATSGTPPGGSNEGEPVNGHKEDSLQKALDEEAAIMNQLKEKHVQDKSNNPFLSSPTSDSKSIEGSKPVSNNEILDLFGDPSRMSSSNAPSSKSNDDLMTNLLMGNNTASGPPQMSNPFADILSGINVSPAGQPQPQQVAPMPVNVFNGSSGRDQSSLGFDANFAAVFGSQTVTSTSVASGETALGTKKPGAPPVPPPPNIKPPSSVSEHSDPAAKLFDAGNDDMTGGNLLPPGTDPIINRSASPSPTPDLMIKGDGTTPILHTPPNDPSFDYIKHEEEEEDNDAHHDASSPAHKISAPPPSSDTSPFGPPFEPPALGVLLNKSSSSGYDVSNTHKFENKPPARPPPPTIAEAPTENIQQSIVADPDLFEFDHSLMESDSSALNQVPVIQPPLAQPLTIIPNAPPPSPFAGFDPSNIQHIAYMQQLAFHQQQQQQQVPQPQQPAPKKKSAFEDLDLEMRHKMTKPKENLNQNQPQVIPVQVPQGMVLQSGMQIPSGYVAPGVIAAPPFTSVVNQTGFDAFGDILQPQKPGTVLPQSVPGNIAPPSSGGGIIKGDLDSSLASLAQNLDINGPKGAAFKKPGQQQFGSPKNMTKTGGAGWPAGSSPGIQTQQGQQPISWAGAMSTGGPSASSGMPANAAQWGSSGAVQPPTSLPGMIPAQGFGVRPVGLMQNVQGVQGPVPGMVAPIMSTGFMGTAGIPQQPVSNSGSGYFGMISGTLSSSSSDPFGAL